jgi:molybdopterin converting factor small subunit
VSAPDQPTLRLLFFSSLRDVVGAEELEWPWPPVSGGAQTVATLLGELYDRWPALASWDARLLVAVDLVYADRAHPLNPGEEVALMPPVQGG